MILYTKWGGKTVDRLGFYVMKDISFTPRKKTKKEKKIVQKMVVNLRGISQV